MTHDTRLDRRTFVAATGLAGTTALAGCSAGGGGDGGDGDDGGDGGDGGDARSFGGWFDGVGNYDGVTDATGQDAVTVSVGAAGNGGNFGFDPAAVTVSPGTAVTWEWTGEGSPHNVVADDGSFESETASEEGFTFEHAFDSAGEYRYVCEPHESMGMKGVVVVE